MCGGQPSIPAKKCGQRAAVIFQVQPICSGWKTLNRANGPLRTQRPCANVSKRPGSHPTSTLLLIATVACGPVTLPLSSKCLAILTLRFMTAPGKNGGTNPPCQWSRDEGCYRLH